MSDNVTSSSTSSSASTASLPTVEEISGWNQDRVKTFLEEKKDELEIRVTVIDKIYEQEVNGKAFLRLNEDKLTHDPFKLKYGPASAIAELIEQIKGEPSVAVPLGSSRKVENEKLTNFWKALNDTVLLSNEKFLRLSEGVHFFGSDKKPSVLFIRKCYNDLLDPVFDENIRNLRITGNPGIGKTFYGYYLLYRLAKLNKTVIYDNHTKPHVILFEQKKAYSLDRTSDSFEISRYLDNPDVWRIVDGKLSTESEAKIILICSPLKDNFKEFDKLGSPHIRFMPVWSWKEIDTCRRENYKELSSNFVRKLYDRWGGIPRYVLENALSDEMQDQLQEAIDLCSEKIFNYIGGTESKKDVSHKLVHIWTNIPDEDIVNEAEAEVDEEDEAEVNILTERDEAMSDEDDEAVSDENDEGNKRKPYTKKIILFASDFVGSQVTKKLKTLILDKLVIDLEASLNSGKSSQFLGTCFEQMAHQKLQNGGKFDVRSLEPSGLTGLNLHEVTEKQDEILPFSAVEEIEDKKYYRPESKIFPSIDSIRAPDTLFQMTTSMKHVATTNNAIAKRVPDWIENRIKQYALRLDLSSGGLLRMSSTASINEGLSNLSTAGEPSTISTTDDVDLSSGPSIPAKRTLYSRKAKKRVKY